MLQYLLQGRQLRRDATDGSHDDIPEVNSRLTATTSGSNINRASGVRTPPFRLVTLERERRPYLTNATLQSTTVQYDRLPHVWHLDRCDDEDNETDIDDFSRTPERHPETTTTARNLDIFRAAALGLRTPPDSTPFPAPGEFRRFEAPDHTEEAHDTARVHLEDRDDDESALSSPSASDYSPPSLADSPFRRPANETPYNLRSLPATLNRATSGQLNGRPGSSQPYILRSHSQSEPLRPSPSLATFGVSPRNMSTQNPRKRSRNDFAADYDVTLSTSPSDSRRVRTNALSTSAASTSQANSSHTQTSQRGVTPSQSRRSQPSASSPPPARRTTSDKRPVATASAATSQTSSYRLSSEDARALDSWDLDSDPFLDDVLAQKQEEEDGEGRAYRGEEYEEDDAGALLDLTGGNNMSLDFMDVPDTAVRLGSFECVVCMDHATELTVTHCGHMFCGGCLKEALNAEAQKRLCPMCRHRVDPRPRHGAEPPKTSKTFFLLQLKTRPKRGAKGKTSESSDLPGVGSILGMRDQPVVLDLR